MGSKVSWARRGNVTRSPGSILGHREAFPPVLWGDIFGWYPDPAEPVFSSPKYMLLVLGGAFTSVLKSRAIFPGPLVFREHTELQREQCLMSGRLIILY